MNVGSIVLRYVLCSQKLHIKLHIAVLIYNKRFLDIHCLLEHTATQHIGFYNIIFPV